MPKEDVLGGVNALFYCLLSFRACLAIILPPLPKVFAFWLPPPPPPLVGHQFAAKVFGKENQWENGPPIKKLQLGQQVLPRNLRNLLFRKSASRQKHDVLRGQPFKRHICKKIPPSISPHLSKPTCETCTSSNENLFRAQLHLRKFSGKACVTIINNQCIVFFNGLDKLFLRAAVTRGSLVSCSWCAY